MFRAVPLVVALFVLLASATGADALSVHKSYSASFSSSRGTAKLTVYTNRTGSLALATKSMTQGSWAAAIYRGTCSNLSTKVVTLTALSVGSSRAASRTSNISATIMAKLKGSKAAVRLTKGSSVVCASLATISVPGSTTATPATGGSGGSGGSNCQAGYSPCLPIVGDLDCPDVRAMGKAPVRVTGSDPYRLDADNDGIGCE